MPARAAVSPAPFITSDALLEHWEGHRRLTRRVIEAFPEEQLHSFSIGGMRTFGALASELLAMGAPMVEGLATGEWTEYAPPAPQSKKELLEAWDESTGRIAHAWARLPADLFPKTVTSFGQFTGTVYWQILYVIENEIHHRAQGYVYLRALGVEPPPFYER